MLESEVDIVLRIRVVDGGIGTNGVPPSGEIEVVECLRGDVRVGRHPAVFLGHPQGGFYAWRHGGDDAIAAHNAMPLHGPSAGSELIVAASRSGSETRTLVISDRPRLRDDDENRARVAVALARRRAREPEPSIVRRIVSRIKRAFQ